MVAMKETHPHCWKSPVTSVTEDRKWTTDVQLWRPNVGKRKEKSRGNEHERVEHGGKFVALTFHGTTQLFKHIGGSMFVSPTLKKGGRKKEKKWQARPEASTYHCSPPAKSPGGRGEAADSSSRLLFFGLAVTSTPTNSVVSLLLLPLAPHLLLLLTYMTSAVGGAPGEHTLRPVPKYKAQAQVERERQRESVMV